MYHQCMHHSAKYISCTEQAREKRNQRDEVCPYSPHWRIEMIKITHCLINYHYRYRRLHFNSWIADISTWRNKEMFEHSNCQWHSLGRCWELCCKADKWRNWSHSESCKSKGPSWGWWWLVCMERFITDHDCTQEYPLNNYQSSWRSVWKFSGEWWGRGTF